MKSPQHRNEVTKEWVEHMLTEFENRNNPETKVTLLSWEIGDATKKGDNYGGDIVKLEAKGSVQYNGEEPHEKDYHHIIKFRSSDPFMKEFAKQVGMTGNECKMYSTVINELNKFQADISDNQYPINFPTLIYSRDTDKENCLVMENMKVLDYNNNSKKDLLGLDEAKLALEQLARLHGISYAYNKKHNFLKKYPTFEIEYFNKMIGMSGGQEPFIDMVINYLKEQDEHQDLLKKVKASKPHLVKRISESFNMRETQIYCLNHGDTWNNNILVKQSGDTKEDKVFFVDWEAAHWNTSSYDLAYFFSASMTPDLRKHHLDELYQHYHSHFTSVTTALNSPVPDWGYEQFKEEMDAVMPWRFGNTMTFVMSLSEKGSKDLEINNRENTNPSKFKKCMAKAFTPLFLKPSVLNVMLKGMMKKISDPVLKEIKNNSNEALNERFLACIFEADQNGLFDIPQN